MPTTVNVRVGSNPSLFIPGVTWPAYTPTSDFSGPANVGNLPGVARTAYGSTVTGGVTQLSGSTYNNLDFINTVVDCRNAMTFNNCRIFIGQNGYLDSVDTIRAAIRVLNGGSTSLVVFNDCEIHIRVQRVLSNAMGRNVIFNRCVITGGVDGPSSSGSGSAPLNFAVVMNDCWVGALGYWRGPSAPSEIHPSDPRSHDDGSQVAITLGSEWHNCTFVIYPNPWVGTGTPNSGSDAGNLYTPSGTNYILTQSALNAYRTADLTYTQTPSQSYLGQARVLTPLGSWAAIMGNRNGGIVDKCQFSGGLVPINLMDPQVTANWSIKKCLFWNDMVNGPGGRSADPTIKGYAVLARTGLNGILDMPTIGPDVNRWSDDEIVFPTFA